MLNILSSAECFPARIKAEQKSLDRKRRKVNYGDFIFLYESYTKVHGIVLKEGQIFNIKKGVYKHADIVGRRCGDKVYSKSGQWLVVLSPTPEIITVGLKHRTQIIHNADISLILMLLNAIPGKNIVESGTGSCSLTCSLSQAVSPNGKIYSFEFHEERYINAIDSLTKYGMKENVELHLRDVVQEGFFSDDSFNGKIDSVFLDLPSPWLVVEHADKCLKEGGHIVIFSPCIEQVQNTVKTLQEFNYYSSDIKTYEILLKPWGIQAYEDNINGTKMKNQDKIAKEFSTVSSSTSMISSCTSMISSCTSMMNSCTSMISSCFSSTVTSCSSTVTSCSSTVTSCSSTVTSCSSTVTSCSSTVTSCSSTVTSCSSTVTSCSSTVTSCSYTAASCFLMDVSCSSADVSCSSADVSCPSMNVSCSSMDFSCSSIGTSCSSIVFSDSVLGSYGANTKLKDVNYYNYNLPTKSHTGYITVAIKKLLDEELYI